ncbi:ABC transporter permease [Candidatus Bathyarchaeota archaeon]|nr:MAG: ABC transporter permease [Candidatus Bathyarchaeota archaeon]
MLSYALKRIVRSWKLYASLILGMMLAATFFGGINVGADTIGKQALDAQLANTPVDISLTPASSGISVPSSSFNNVIRKVLGVSGVVSAEALGSVNEQFYPYNGSIPNIKGIQDNSPLYHHLTLVSGREISNANESVINSDSQFAQTYKPGQSVKYTFGQFGQTGPRFNVTLTVVGEVQLDTVAVNTLGASPIYYGPSGSTAKPASTLIVSWDKTFSHIADWAYNQTRFGKGGDYSITGAVNVYLDRPKLLSAFNVEGSITQVQQIDDQVSNVAALNGFSSQPNLISPLQQFSSSIFGLRLTFTIFSIPVFFVAWFVGRTVSQASFNLRRREIGLLMTKGFSESQLFRHFLVEALLVGLIGGSLGLAAAVLLNPYFVQVLSGSYQSEVFLSQDTAIATMIFTIVLTLLAIYSPARAAASMDPSKALREYVYLEDTRPSKKRGAIVAFSLGLYKIILLLLGINFQNIGRYLFGVNFLLAIVLIIIAVLDYGLNIIGPFLFLYGATQLSTGVALRFHMRFASLSKRLVGDIASLASKSVFRNPRRVTALVFLVALIAGYSIWVIGDMASLQDYNVRQAEVQVGSDLRVSGIGNFNLTYATLVASQLRGWSNITGATPESDNTLSLSSRASITIKAIDPATWRQGAYYEPEWFSGNINTVFQNMQSNSQSIVLDHGLASHYSIQQGGTVIVSQNVSLTVISFFGPDYSQQTQGQPFGYSYFQPEGWSFVPLSLFTQYPSVSGINSVLVKAEPGVSFTELANSIQKAYPSLAVSTAQDITQGIRPVVSSGAQASAQNAGAVIANGTQNVLRLGTVFAGLAASIGIGAVTYTGFKEREKETTMLSVRGLSYKQMLGLLVTEALPLVIFALILATAVGLITVRGDSLAQNSLTPNYASLLAPRRVVFPLWALENILAIVGLLFLGVFLPAITAARKDLSKMSRTVRFA